MKEEKQRVSISNFLYVDRDKIASFYAQIFGNHPLTLEILKAENEEQDVKVGGTISVAKGEFQSKDSVKSELKKVVDPHDAKTVDVIAKLLDLDKTNLLIVSGSLFLWDKVALEMFRRFLEFVLDNPNMQEPFLQDLLQNIPNLQNEEFIKNLDDLKELLKLVMDLLSKPGLEAAFFLRGSDGNLYGGTINPKFLTEPITSFHFKHGANWLQDVVLIGMKEESISIDFPKGNFMDFIMEILPHISSFVFPPDTIKVSPIAMFTVVGELEG